MLPGMCTIEDLGIAYFWNLPFNISGVVDCKELKVGSKAKDKGGATDRSQVGAGKGTKRLRLSGKGCPVPQPWLAAGASVASDISNYKW